jgi:hypothetical protein
VAQLHRDVLGREAGVGEFVPLVAALDERTLTHAQVAKTLLNSSESRTRVVSGLYLEVLRRDATPTEVTSGVAFLKAGGTQEQLRARLFGSVEYLTTLGGGTVRGFLEALFRDALGRPIDPASLSGGLNFLARGGTRLVYAVSILRRVESNRREVDLIYRQFLSRPATPDELTARAASLTRGLTNEALVVLLILGSDEYRSRVA